MKTRRKSRQIWNRRNKCIKCNNFDLLLLPAAGDFFECSLNITGVIFLSLVEMNHFYIPLSNKAVSSNILE
jgi:hypothetical protein